MEKRDQLDKKIREAYTNLNQEPSIPGALGSSENFYKAIKKRYGSKVSRRRIERILGTEPAYAQFRWPRWRFPRRQVSTSRVGEMLQGDLGFMDTLNRGQSSKYVLLICDTLSGFVFLRPLPNKSVEATAKALESILLDIASEPENVRKVPRILFTDRGGEFVGAKTSEVLSAHGIVHWVAQGGPKATLAERKMQQFKHLAYKYLKANPRHNLRPLLPAIAKVMNKTPSRVLPHQWSPYRVWEDPHGAGAEAAKFRRSKRDEFLRVRLHYPRPFSFGLHDFVKFQTESKNRLFKKAVRGELWGTEVFRVVQRFASIPHLYALSDSEDRRLAIRAYSPELKRVRRSYLSID